jgi:hypothetical protein
MQRKGSPEEYFITPRPRIPMALAVGGIGLQLTPFFGESSEDFS